MERSGENESDLRRDRPLLLAAVDDAIEELPVEQLDEFVRLHPPLGSLHNREEFETGVDAARCCVRMFVSCRKVAGESADPEIDSTRTSDNLGEPLL